MSASTAVVLIVEKREALHEALRDSLDVDLRVLEAGDLRAAQQAEEGEEPDLLISDLRGAGTPGSSLARRLQTDPALEATPVLLLAPPAEDTVSAAGAEGAGPVSPDAFTLEELRRLVGHHLAAEGRPPGPPLVPDAPLPEAVEAVVEARLGDPTFTAEDLAEATDLSRRQLTRRMKDTMGTTPAAFIRTRRLKRAEELLASGPETVKQVAAAVGFASPSAFSKAFREHAGIAPSTYAEQHEE